MFPGGGVVYGIEGFRTWLWIAAGMAIVMLAVAEPLPGPPACRRHLHQAPPLVERVSRQAESG